MIYQPKLRGFFVFRSFVCLYQCLRLFCFVFWVNLGKNDYVSLTHFSQRSPCVPLCPILSPLTDFKQYTIQRP